MREKIKTIATELLITHGVRGLRFGDIAERLGITRANIHYHFGTKEKLIDEVIADYVRDTAEITRGIWTDEQATYIKKATSMMAFNRRRYNLYNRSGKKGQPWSLISRMRLESNQLNDASRETLRSFTLQIEGYLYNAVTLAQDRGELVADAPAAEIAIQLISIVDSAGSITQDGGSFDRLEQLYTAHINIVTHAYGTAVKMRSAASRRRSRALA